MQRPEDPSGSLIREYRTINEPLVLFGLFVWVHAFSEGRPGSPGSDGASPYRPERRSLLRGIVLVVVVVLVLDSLCGNPNRSARMTRAPRFGRSLSLPP
jgi:hypothetical protein